MYLLFANVFLLTVTKFENQAQIIIQTLLIFLPCPELPLWNIAA
jgi:hypothetical protein